MNRPVLSDRFGRPLTIGSDRRMILAPPPPAGLAGTPSLILDIPAQSDITASEYNSLEDSSGNNYDFAYVSGGKAQKSSALQLDGYDTLLTVNNDFNDGSLYRSAAGVDLAGEFFPNSGVGTVMIVAAVRAYKHFFTSPDMVVGGSSSSFRPLKFNNATNRDSVISNGISTDNSSAPSLNTYYVFTSRFNGSNVRGQRDNGTEYTQSGDARVALTEQAQLFFNGGDAACFDGYLAFLVFWPTYLADGEITQSKNFLKGYFPSLNV
jgi:hypothetical protein